MSNYSKPTLTACVAAGLLLAALAWPALHGQIQTFDDLLSLQLPFRSSYANGLQQGRPFEWCAGLFCGFDLAGEGQIGAYHPLHLAVYRMLPIYTAFELDLLWPYPFLLLGTWLWLRRRVGIEAAAFGALSFTFAGFNTLHFHHPTLLATVAHLPWLLWLLDLQLTQPDRRRAAVAGVGLGMVTGSQLLIGHPQIIWMTAMAEIAYAVYLILTDRAAAKRLPAVVGFKLVGLLLAAPQILSMFGYFASSARQTATAEYRHSFGVTPLRAIQILAPYAFAARQTGGLTFNETALYCGAAPLMLAAVGTVCRPSDHSLCRLQRGALALAAVAFVLSLGEHGRLYDLLAHIPVIRNFRCPGRYGLLVQLGVVSAAAISFQSLSDAAVSHRAKRLSRSLLACWTACVGVTVWAMIPRGEPALASDAISPVALLVAGPAIFALAGALVCLSARGSRSAMMGVILLTAADLGVYGLATPAHRQSVSRVHLLDDLDLPDGAGQGRLLGGDNRLVLVGLSAVEGYTGFPPARRLDYADVATWRVANVRFVKASLEGHKLSVPMVTLTRWAVEQGQTAEQVNATLRRSLRSLRRMTYQPGGWLVLDTALGRAWLVGVARVSQDPARDLPTIDPAKTCLVDEAVSIVEGGRGTVIVTRDESGALGFDVETSHRQMLVVSESFHAGWGARVDGLPAATHRVDGDFLGCVIPPGKHRVDLTFRNPCLRPGLACSAAGVLVAALLLLLACRPPAQTAAPEG